MARAKKKKVLSLEEKLEQALVPVEEWPYEVPENWCWSSIEAVTTRIKRGKAPKYVEISAIPVFAQKCNQKDGTIALEKAQFLNPIMLSKIADDEFLMPNDIIINSTGTGTLGRVGFYRQRDSLGYDKVLPDSHITVVRGSKSINAVYLYFYLKTFQEYLELQGVGSTNQKELRPNTIASISIPVPPIAEQKRIVEQIEQLFQKLDKVKDKLEFVLQETEIRKNALLCQVFNGKITEKWRKENSIRLESWMSVTIDDISDVKGGKRVPKGMELIHEDTGHPYIKAGNLKNGTVIDDRIMYVPDEVLKYIKNYTVKEGDVYITNVGACIGDCGVIPKRYDGANLTENAVKMTNLKCDSNFLALYLSTSDVQQTIKGMIASATLGKLSIANIKAIKISLPTIEEQKEIVKIIKQFLEREKLIKEQVTSVTKKIDLIKRTILAKAFRGELGTNNPNEESAIELLKKII